MEDLEGLLELDKSRGIYIDIGTKLYLEIEGVGFSVTSIFIGMLQDEFMLITFPTRYKSIKNKFYPGNKMVIKYLYDGSIYAFQAGLIETITQPIKALAIEFPRVVQQRELRVAKRNDVVIPGRVEAKNAEFKAIIFDISKKGCRFKYNYTNNSKKALRDNDLLRIYLQFPGISNEVGAMGCVRNIKRDKGQLLVGAEFQDITKTFLTSLVQFLYSIEDF